jgi:hypothetical protein
MRTSPPPAPASSSKVTTLDLCCGVVIADVSVRFGGGGGGIGDRKGRGLLGASNCRSFLNTSRMSAPSRISSSRLCAMVGSRPRRSRFSRPKALRDKLAEVSVGLLPFAGCRKAPGLPNVTEEVGPSVKEPRADGGLGQGGAILPEPLALLGRERAALGMPGGGA